MKADHERIWLQNAEDAKHCREGRMWCQDKAWPIDKEDGEPTEYVRADLLATARAEARAQALEEAAAVFDVYAADQRASIIEGRVTGIGVNNAEVRAETWKEAAWQLRNAAADPTIRALIEKEG